MEIDFERNLCHCILCDAVFCSFPVSSTTTYQSEVEPLLFTFCHYFDLSSSDRESLDEKRIGFPFCEKCQGDTLATLNQLHNNLLSIHDQITQLVTKVSLSIVNLVNKNDLEDSNNEDSPNKEDQNAREQTVVNIRKSIMTRFNPQVSVVRLDFKRLHRQDKITKKQQQQQNNPAQVAQEEPQKSADKSRAKHRQVKRKRGRPRKEKNVVKKQSSPIIKKEKPETDSDIEPGILENDEEWQEEMELADGPDDSNSELTEKERRRLRTLRDKADPVIEVEPNLFRRKTSGWSFRREADTSLNDLGIETFVCLAPGCNRRLVAKKKMIQHITLCHINKWEVCDLCEKSFRTKELLNEHKCIPAAQGTRKFRSQNMGNGQFIFDDIWPYYEVDRLENEGCSLKCATCGSLQREQYHMQRHIRITHSETPKFACDTCGKMFFSKSHLRDHLASHTDSLEAVCDQCGEFYKNAASLKIHVENKHIRGPKSFKCDFPNCDKAFANPFGLSRHRKTAGHPAPVDPILIDPLVCPLCSREFFREKVYNRHRERCQGKKEYLCPICQKKSCDRSALRMHMALLHKEEYMNYPEGRYEHDPTRTTEDRVARLRHNNKHRGGGRRQKEQKAARRLKNSMDKIVQLKQHQNQSQSSSSS